MHNSRFGPTSAFASCPAATGEGSPPAGCQHFSDTAHRCGLPRGEHWKHRCTCAYEWLSLTADLLDDAAARALMHLPRHEARP